MGVHAGVYLTAGGFFLLDSLLRAVGLPHHLALIVEWRKRGTIKLGAFWARRARRLLPALFVMLIGVAIIYGVFVPAGTYPTLRGDALSALFYFANWHYIASGSDYFHMTGLTSPLIHTWSLAVEEQFYLVWPLVFLGVMKLTRLVAGAPGRGCRGRARVGLRDGAALQPHQHQSPLLRHRHPRAVRPGGGHARHRPAAVGREPEEGRRVELAGADAVGAPWC